MNPDIFREYDIRGVAERDLSDSDVTRIGLAIGTRLVGGGAQQVVLARDARPSSPRIQASLARGLAAAGISVLELGVCPTPVLYWASERLGKGAGVMVTGSHNPPQDNGIKIISGRANWYGSDIAELRSLCETGDFERSSGNRTGSDRSRGLSEIPAVGEGDVLQAYLDELLRDFHQAGRMEPSGSLPALHVVVDAGNGVAGLTAPRLFRGLGCRVTELYCEVDGRFPNHHPDPIVDENLADLTARVREAGADLGLAFDGDGDRLGVVDGEGRIVRADELLILFGRDLLVRHPKATIIADVKCSRRLFDDLGRRGAEVIMWKTGHSLIKARMRETGALLAGELAAHICFGDRYLPFDDAVYAGARLLELLHSTRQPLGGLLSDLPKVYSTPEVRVCCPEPDKFRLVQRIKDEFSAVLPVVEVDGVRLEFEDGWGLVRASNTQAALTLRFEAESEARVEEIRSVVVKKLEQLMRETCEGLKP